MELARVDMIVFDGIARPEHDCALQTRDGLQQRELHLARQGGRDAVGVDRRIVQALRLEEDLVPLALGEAHDLVLDRRAVARTDAFDLAGVHRRPMEVGADDLVGGRRGLGDVAGDLRRGDRARQIGEGLGRLVAVLLLERAVVDRAAIEPRRRAGLETTESGSRRLQLLRE